MRWKRSFLARPRAQLLLTLLSLVLAAFSAVSLMGEVRPLHVILLFFGGFGAGATLTATMARVRLQRLHDEGRVEGVEGPRVESGAAPAPAVSALEAEESA